MDILSPLILFLGGVLSPEFIPEGEPNFGQLCLASVGYGEARSEPIEGEACVMQVVLNRSLKYSEPLCAVASSPSQFLGYGQSVAEHSAWTRSYLLANLVLSNSWPVSERCKQATNFWQSGLSDKRFKKLTTVGHHTFYVEE